MNASQLKYEVESRGTEQHFFDRSTMKFFGDTMRNYGVRKATVIAYRDREGNYYNEGIEREAWELYRRRPVKHGLRSSAYFDPETFEHIVEKK